MSQTWRDIHTYQSGEQEGVFLHSIGYHMHKTIIVIEKPGLSCNAYYSVEPMTVQDVK